MIKNNTIKTLVVTALIVGGFGLTASKVHADSTYGYTYNNDYSYGYTTPVNGLSSWYVPGGVNPLSSSYVPTVKTKKKTHKTYVAPVTYSYNTTSNQQYVPVTNQYQTYPTYPSGNTVVNQNPNPVQTNPVVTPPVVTTPPPTNNLSSGGPVVGGNA